MIRSSSSTRNTALGWICAEEKWVKSAHKVAIQCGVADDQLEDVFQEALTSMTFNIIKDKFNSNSALSTYFVGIARNISLKLMRSKVSHEELGQAQHLTIEHEDNPEIREQDLKNLMAKAFSKLKEGCQKILKLYSLSLPMEDIADEMGFENKQSAKNKAKGCRDKLKRAIQEDEALYHRLKPFI
jgi:RNA polymerase sigma factor (sigma-70 family)